MHVSTNNTTATTSDHVQTAGLTDLIHCITSFEESHSYLLWYSRSSFVVRSNEFNFDRIIGQTVFEETLLHYFIGAFIEEICSV